MRRGAGVALILAVVAVTAVGVVGVTWLVTRDEPASASGSPDADGFPEGVFRYRLKKEDVLNVVPDIAPAYLSDAIGTFTWTVRDGVITLVQTECTCSIPRVSGRYTVTGDHLTVHWPTNAANGVEFCTGDCDETVRWTYDGTALHIDPLSAIGYTVVFWGVGKPWRRIR